MLTIVIEAGFIRLWIRQEGEHDATVLALLSLGSIGMDGVPSGSKHLQRKCAKGRKKVV
jgi:hypothetical protein